MVTPCKQYKDFLQYDPRVHGITQSLLGMWLECREKANLYLLGIDTPPSSQALMDGDIVHAVIERATREVMNGQFRPFPNVDRVRKQYLDGIEKTWLKDNPRATAKQHEMLQRALTFAEAVLPGYFKYWHKFFHDVKWVMAEQDFRIPYRTRSGIDVFLRGKIDGVYRDGDELWVLDTKNKARIEESRIADTLPQNIQLKLYSWAIRQLLKQTPTGAVWNIIRRPGFRDTNLETLYEKTVADVAKRPGFYFMQMEIRTDEEELAQWADEFADMVEDFVQWALENRPHYRNGNACETKYGLCQYLEFCNNGNKSFYVVRDSIFREL